MKMNEVISVDLTKTEITKLLSTPEIKEVANHFRKNGFELRIVGGAVRDLLLGKKPKDIDFATNATPDQMKQFLNPTIDTGIQHGTITYVINHVPFEITTLRIDKQTDGRHAEVEFTTDFKQDAERRDLTFNAMSIDMDGKIYDYFNGIADLRANRARFVGDPTKRIQEDYLRILRYFRFQGRMDRPEFDPETLQAIKDNASGLQQISVERIWLEMEKLLSGNHVNDILEKMHETNILEQIKLPYRKVTATFNNAIVRLASILTEEEAVFLSEYWKMSGAEAKLLCFIAKYKQISYEDAEKMASDKTPKEFLYYLFLSKNDHLSAKRIMEWQVPIFPLGGNDLLSLGYKGLTLGNALKDLRQKWKDSNFKLSKEELLKLLEQ